MLCCKSKLEVSFFNQPFKSSAFLKYVFLSVSKYVLCFLFWLTEKFYAVHTLWGESGNFKQLCSSRKNLRAFDTQIKPTVHKENVTLIKVCNTVSWFAYIFSSSTETKCRIGLALFHSPPPDARTHARTHSVTCTRETGGLVLFLAWIMKQVCRLVTLRSWARMPFGHESSFVFLTVALCCCQMKADKNG